MDSTQEQSSLTALVVFENTINKELVRSLHVYRFEDGKEKEVEREFLFKEKGSYVEMGATPLLGLRGFRVSDFFQGKVIGLWLCIFAFQADSPPSFTRIPPILLISRNPKLRSVPKLVNDLKLIFQLSGIPEDRKPSQGTSKETCDTDRDHCRQSKRRPTKFDQDLNCLPNSVGTCEYSRSQIEQRSPGSSISKKKKRAAPEDIARIDLQDLVKYFDLPIIEASRNLKVGLTVLKKKCREFGIPRWPHRKIKSLDSLINELQGEGWQQEEDGATAMAVERRRKLLEEEKEIIERKPFTEIQSETKKFRQDVFKRRYRARALKKQD